MIPRRALAITISGVALVHLLIGLMPDPVLSLPTNLVMFAVNLFVAWSGLALLPSGGRRRLGLFAAGYLVLFLLLVVLLQRESLFLLLIVVYASVFRDGLLLGLFGAFVLSYVVFQPYAFETFVPLALLWILVWRSIQAGVSFFVSASLAAGLLVLGLILLPFLHMLVQETPQTLLQFAGRPEVREALLVSLASASISTLVAFLFGVPLAYALARGEPRGRSLVDVLVDLPILLPKPVVGIAMLSLLGPGSPLGEWLEGLGLGLAGRFGGIVLAQTIVASPFLIKAAVTAFEGVPEPLETAARTLGARPWQVFARVALPLASRGVLTGVILCWARAIGEFGAIMLFAPHPLSGSVLVYNEFLKGGVSESRPIAMLLMLICLWVFVLMQFGRSLLPAPWSRSPLRRAGA